MLGPVEFILGFLCLLTQIWKKKLALLHELPELKFKVHLDKVNTKSMLPQMCLSYHTSFLFKKKKKGNHLSFAVAPTRTTTPHFINATSANYNLSSGNETHTHTECRQGISFKQDIITVKQDCTIIFLVNHYSNIISTTSSDHLMRCVLCDRPV